VLRRHLALVRVRVRVRGRGRGRVRGRVRVRVSPTLSLTLTAAISPWSAEKRTSVVGTAVAGSASSSWPTQPSTCATLAR